MTIEDFRTKWNKACLASNISNVVSYCMQQPLSNVLTDIHIQKINNSMKLKYIMSESVIEWQVGTPIKSEQYLVLHLDHKGEKTINTDIWRDNGTWQSGWHDIIAWCAMSDINI